MGNLHMFSCEYWKLLLYLILHKIGNLHLFLVNMEEIQDKLEALRSEIVDYI